MRGPGLAAPLIVAIGLVAAAMAFAVLTSLLDAADASTDQRLARLEAQALAAEGRVAALEQDLADARSEIGGLREAQSLLANRAPPPAPAAPVAPLPGVVGAGEDFEAAPTEDPTEIVTVARERFNVGVTQPRNRTMLEILGPPRGSYSQDCQSVTNESLRALLEERQVGPIRVTMIRPAIESLERVLTRLEETDPDLYAQLGTAGALCVRNVRGSSSSISNHSWGTAIDLTMAGQLDPFADGGTQFALLILAEHFNDEGWYWGAGYRREDSMHFEVGEERLREWFPQGLP